MKERSLRIAVSGKSGCGNTTVSRLLAERLNVRFINYTFRSMAEEQNRSFEEMYQMAQNDDTWDKYLDRRQVELAMEGSCVLGSRLAIWMLKDADLSVYLSVSPHVRAQRIHQREGGSLEDKQRETEKRDHYDRERYLRIYGIDIDDWSGADLIIDADIITPDEIVERIISQIKGQDYR
jgi:cytidylate kinase